MRRTLFLSRVAFICNVFFVLAFSLQVSRWLHNPEVFSFIMLIGYVLVLLFNPLVNLCYLVLWLMRKKLVEVIPAWLITANILFLVMQIFYILYLNDTSHH